MEFNFTVEFTFSLNQFFSIVECNSKFYMPFAQIELSLTKIPFRFIMYSDDPYSWKGVLYV